MVFFLHITHTDYQKLPDQTAVQFVSSLATCVHGEYCEELTESAPASAKAKTRPFCYNEPDILLMAGRAIQEILAEVHFFAPRYRPMSPDAHFLTSIG